VFEDLTKSILQRRESKFSKVMREFKHGKLHHGSKKGEIVKDVKVAQAIAASEAGMSRRKKRR
jgi:uncharacterized membrane protein